MVIGGCTGGAVGLALHAIWPNLVPHPQIYAIVGMAGFFAGAAHAPISTIIMVSELLTESTDFCSRQSGYRPYASCSAIVGRYTTNNLHRGSIRLPIRVTCSVDVFEGHSSCRRSMGAEASRFSRYEIASHRQLLANSRQHYFPVIDHENRFVGIFSSDDVLLAFSMMHFGNWRMHATS